MYPGYDGPRPRMQIWHGSSDGTLAPANYQETIEHVDGQTCSTCSQTPTASRENYPQQNYQTDGLRRPRPGHLRRPREIQRTGQPDGERGVVWTVDWWWWEGICWGQGRSFLGLLAGREWGFDSFEKGSYRYKFCESRVCKTPILCRFLMPVSHA